MPFSRDYLAQAGEMLAELDVDVEVFILGVLGEYIGRVLAEVQKRPVFVVDDAVGIDAPPGARDRARRTPPAGQRFE